MNNEIIVLGNDVVETVFKPVSLFLNSVVAGTTLLFHSQTTREYGSDNKELHVFKYTGTDGKVYNFTHFDLSNFMVKGTPISEAMNMRKGVDAQLQLELTVLSSDPRLRSNGDKMYPLFAFKGYDKYVADKLAGVRDIKDVKAELFDSGIMNSHKERYYRTLNCEEPIMFYAD